MRPRRLRSKLFVDGGNLAASQREPITKTKIVPAVIGQSVLGADYWGKTFGFLSLEMGWLSTVLYF
jgi:hypothetical protein